MTLSDTSPFWLKDKIYLRKLFLNKNIVFHTAVPYSWKLPRRLFKGRNPENTGWSLTTLVGTQWFLFSSSLLPSCGVQRTGSGASLVSPHSPVLLRPGGQCRDSHIGPVQVWQSLLAGLCAILPRIYPLVGNKNVSFSQIYLVLMLVLYVGEVPYILTT